MTPADCPHCRLSALRRTCPAEFTIMTRDEGIWTRVHYRPRKNPGPFRPGGWSISLPRVTKTCLAHLGDLY